MRSRAGRKTTPKVRHGQVQKKDRHQWTEFQELLDNTAFSTIKMKPEDSYVHVVDRRRVLDFVELIPNWRDMSKGLSALVLGYDGCSHQTDINYSPKAYNSIWLSPFPKDMTLYWSRSFAIEHKSITEFLGIDLIETGEDEIMTVWTKPQAQAWQLLHLFLYDLFCHNECTSQSRDNYHHQHKLAEEYAIKTAQLIVSDYERTIGRFY
jgi:hypothetical protein